MSGSATSGLRVPPHVIIRAFPAEIVLLNIRTGQYHGLDPVAGRMLDAVSTAGNIAGALESLAVVFEGVQAEQLAADLERFCADLLDRGLLEPA